MKNFKDFILEQSNGNHYKYHPKSKDELINLIKTLIKSRGYEGHFSDIDTSKITDMSELFYESRFNGDISAWDVSNVKDMNMMFRESKFDGDISAWDVRNVKDMKYMFYKSPLEKNPPKWYKR